MNDLADLRGDDGHHAEVARHFPPEIRENAEKGSEGRRERDGGRARRDATQELVDLAVLIRRGAAQEMFPSKAKVTGDPAECRSRSNGRPVVAASSLRLAVEERDVPVPEIPQMARRGANRLLEVEVHERNTRVVGAVADEAEGPARSPQAGDALVVERHLHQQRAVGRAGLDERCRFRRIVRGGHQKPVSRLAGRLGDAGEKDVIFHLQRVPARGEEQRHRVGGATREGAPNGMGLEIQFGDRLLDSGARLGRD